VQRAESSIVEMVLPEAIRSQEKGLALMLLRVEEVPDVERLSEKWSTDNDPPNSVRITSLLKTSFSHHLSSALSWHKYDALEEDKNEPDDPLQSAQIDHEFCELEINLTQGTDFQAILHQNELSLTTFQDNVEKAFSENSGATSQ
jgi:hypothetical protein